MRYYWMLPNDLPANRWLMWYEPKTTDELTPKPVFQDLVCPRCPQADHSKIFERGFEEAGEFKSKRDLFGTTDNFLCVSEKVKKLLTRHRVGGFRLKPVGSEGWHVMNVDLKVTAVRVYKSDIWEGRRLCPNCKRALSTAGVYKFERQISPPKKSPVFFTVIHERQGFHKGPDIFVTEDVIKILQAAGIKGCRFNKLYSSEEEDEMKRRRRGGKEWWPPGACIDL